MRWKTMAVGAAAVSLAALGAAAWSAGAAEVPPRSGPTRVVNMPPQFNPDGSPWRATKQFPNNGKGQSYGNMADYHATGKVPDLMAVVTPDGRRGYALSSEYLDPEAQGKRILGIYDAEGTKIGEQTVDFGTPEPAQPAIKE